MTESSELIKPVRLTSYLIAYLIAVPLAVSSALLLRFFFHVPSFVSYATALAIVFTGAYLVARKEPKRSTFILVLTIPAILVTVQTAVFYLTD